MRIGELLGLGAGAAIAPLAALGSFVRRGRVVHKHGVTYRAEVVPEAKHGAALDVAGRLAGPALVHFSSGLWRLDHEIRPDILGCSIRFRSTTAASALPAPGDQDLLLATLRRAWQLAPAALVTNVHSFLWDDYYGVGKFDSAELGLVKWRVTTPRIPGSAASRVLTLEAAVKAGTAVLHLQARDVLAGALYQPVAAIRLLERVAVDETALRFSPFRAGRGIVPRGFLNALRILPYAASQLARPKHAP
jgi:hypothetical protein